jgi:sarcosine oxidase subunit gamma
MPVALDYGDPAREGERARALGLCDVSALPRITLKGPGAEGWLRQKGLPAPAGVYEVARGGRGEKLIRTGRSEFLIEDGPAGGAALQAILAGKDPIREVYRIPRQDASFLLTGKETEGVLLETCGVDLAAREPKAVFSRVAGVSCALLPVELGAVQAFQIWCDGSYGAYLWDTLLAIVVEKGGGPVGLSTLFSEVFG